MPKVLSLKKQAVPPKNQKAITQFFTQTTTAKPQTQHNSQVKSQNLPSKSVKKQSAKRKATSPVIVETIELCDKPDEAGYSKTIKAQSNGYHTPKKHKNELYGPKKSPVNGARKTSPQKENNVSMNSQRPFSQTSELNDLDNDIQKDTRLPLTPIKSSNNKDFEFTNEMCNIKDNSDHGDKVNQKSSTVDNGNHVQTLNDLATSPKKVLQLAHCATSIIKVKTPKKSPGKAIKCTPRVESLKTPEKLTTEELSPSKSGSTVKTVEFSPGTADMFGDQWDLEGIEENCAEDLDLTKMQRCEVLSVTQHPGRLELRLKNANNNRGTLLVEGVWLDTPLSPSETISVLASRNSSGQFFISSAAGLLALRPDHLVSCTSVVAGVFCRRRAVLQERWRGLDSGNAAMTIGILVHELVQKALTENITDNVKLRIEADRLIRQSIQMLYDAGISEEEASSNMQLYIAPLAEFMETYVAKSPLSKQPQKDQWRGSVDKVLDIEENMCCPQLGLKGKIDATLQVTVHERNGRRRAVMPLELKSGKASVSAEHRGQLVQYGMMLSLLRGEDPTVAAQSGLLLYLKEQVTVREVNCGYPERRDLLLLRNQLVRHLAASPGDLDPEQITDIEDASCALQQKLPEPVHHQTACAKCPYLTLCSLHLWHTDGPSVSETHPLSKLREQALGHLSPEHIKYFLHWAALLRMEERGQMVASPLHALWTDSVEKRSKRGTCAANLKLKTVEPAGDRYLHTFDRQIKEIETLNSSNNKSGPQEGEFSIVSLDSRPWIAAGVVTVAKEREICILLERDLSRRSHKDTAFHIDTYESYATTVQNLTNLGVLLEDSERSERLRKLIIDREPPVFEKKLPREVGRLGTKLMRALNIEQQRAVLRGLAAADYALLQGLPGTGKTQTISVLIQMLVGLKQRVLVTAHTHSAVDTVLSRLPESLKVMRLGSSSRVAAGLLSRCEQQLTAKCETAKQLEELYDSMEVVGVTCLGAAHALLSRTTFDVCIVDEATQVLQSTVIRPLLAARRFVLVGDPEQLPPVVRSRAARRLGMEESLFHRLMRDDATATLRLQYRMNQPIVNLANKVAYRDRLRCADEKVAEARVNINMEKLSELPSWLQKACSPEADHAVFFLDMPSIESAANVSSKSSTNTEEACVVMAIVDTLIQGGVNPSDIGVIAPYRDQVSLLRRALRVDCSTVDQFQGRDKSVILYSCTKRDGQDDRKIKEGEILNDQRRLAVSVTRAKHKLLIVGNSLALQRYMPLHRLLQACTSLPLDKQDLQTVVMKYRNNFV